MKPLRFLSLIILAVMALTVTAATPKTPREKLLKRLAAIQKKGYMYGHQDDPFYGLTWEYEDGRSDTKDLVGDYPGIMGFDLGGLEVGDEKNLDSVPFNLMRQEIIRQHERGGIVTISWHPRNPVLGTTAWIENDIKAYDKAVEALKEVGREDLVKQIDNPRLTVHNILKGGKTYDKYQQWITRIADFIASLKDSKGNQVPVIFRPYHENHGSWFWWGNGNCSESEYHELWNMTQDFFCSYKDLGNSIVWSYSPTWTHPAAMPRYPGDDRVDLIGTDIYSWGGADADFISKATAELDLVKSIGEEHGKLIAITECGNKNSPDATWWQRVFKPIIEKYPAIYFLTWRNYPKEHFGASPDATTAADFKAWYSDPHFLFARDVKKIK